MITQRYEINCQAPRAWLNLTGGSVAQDGMDGPLICTHDSIRNAPSDFQARREFELRGWYVADDGKTYCPWHSENARRLDKIAREKARSA